jgi:hypothetical protein
MLTADEVLEMADKLSTFEDELFASGTIDRLSGCIGNAAAMLYKAQNLMRDTRSEAERRADYEADRADDKISSGEV